MKTAAYGDFEGQRLAPYPTLRRPRSGRVVAGVAAGLAQHLRVEVFFVRLALGLLALLSGVGVLAYALLWVFTRVDDGEQPPVVSKVEVPKVINVMIVVLALFGAIATVEFTSGVGWSMLVPLVIAAAGALIAWQAYDRGLRTNSAIISVAAGTGLVMAGILVAAAGWQGDQAFGPAVLAVVLTVLGIGALVVPLVLKLWRSLSEEQAAKAAANERAEIASRLHDSVLQTLALIQKRSGDGAEVARLARAQERELRGWLFDAEEKTSQSVFAAVGKAAGEVEDLFGLVLSPVTVGVDAPLTEASQSAVLAAREAMVNAAKHAQAEEIDVYAEIFAGELSIFVRDRGVGFDPAAVAEDRHGIRDSIIQRMERIGGTASIDSAPGKGTEIKVAVTL